MSKCLECRCNEKAPGKPVCESCHALLMTVFAYLLKPFKGK